MGQDNMPCRYGAINCQAGVAHGKGKTAIVVTVSWTRKLRELKKAIFSTLLSAHRIPILDEFLVAINVIEREGRDEIASLDRQPK